AGLPCASIETMRPSTIRTVAVSARSSPPLMSARMWPVNTQRLLPTSGPFSSPRSAVMWAMPRVVSTISGLIISIWVRERISEAPGAGEFAQKHNGSWQGGAGAMLNSGVAAELSWLAAAAAADCADGGFAGAAAEAASTTSAAGASASSARTKRARACMSAPDRAVDGMEQLDFAALEVCVHAVATQQAAAPIDTNHGRRGGQCFCISTCRVLVMK